MPHEELHIVLKCCVCRTWNLIALDHEDGEVLAAEIDCWLECGWCGAITRIKTRSSRLRDQVTVRRLPTEIPGDDLWVGLPTTLRGAFLAPD